MTEPLINQTATSQTHLSASLQPKIQQYAQLKQALVDFVLEAEDDIATGLETYSAKQLSRWSKPTLSGLNRTDLAIDMFVTEGQVDNRSVLDHFIQTSSGATSSPGLTTDEKSWIRQWEKSFNGLFAVASVEADRYILKNWLTAKRYSVWPNATQTAEMIARLAPGEIILTRLSPLEAAEWTFSGPSTLLGKLGKPKLAVAIGNFRQWFPDHLYGDAPELLEAAWESVAQQYEDFVAFFGSSQVTMPGHQLNKKLEAYQSETTEKQLSEVGLSSDQSIQDMAKEAGLSDAEIEEAMTAVGEDSVAAKKLLESKQSLKMVMPKVTLPDELRRAEAVTVFVYPRWGQTFLTDYKALIQQLESTEADPEILDRLIVKHLEHEKAIAPVWAHLAETYPQPLELALRRVLANPAFSLEQDLDSTLAHYRKSLTPTLPESASVPVHLDTLFKAALKAVGKQAGKSSEQKMSKKKKSKKKKSGFGR
ncbi:MAG: hypothetical protein AAFQ40_06860 [Cyanobacteria bacterium J06623_5]